MTSINPSAVALAENHAREFFGLALPLTMESLKSAFRAAAKLLHTDTSGDENTKEKFIAMKAAYDFLVGLEGMEYVFGEHGQNGNLLRLATIDGTPLYELGLGLGPMKNVRDCERCGHKGYTEERDHFHDPFPGSVCSDCNYLGRVRSTTICHSCYGTGGFRQRRSGKLVVCRACSGIGVKFGYQTCPRCKGTKRVSPPRVTYRKCYECDGTGEIELFSPLLPKGRFAR
jgi:DnaJ-class molecular chaperone